MTDYHREWSEARDRLRKAVTTLGYPSDLADLLAKELGSPRGIERLKSYIYHAKPRSLEMIVDEILERAGYADRELHLHLLMELVEILDESAEQTNSSIDSVQCASGAFERAGGVVTGAEAGGRILVKRVDKEPGACYDVEEFFRLTRPRYPESVVSDGRVVGYDNEMVIRYLDRVIVNDQDYEVRFKDGITVTV